MIRLLCVCILTFCFIGCISKSKKNESVLNGLWERVDLSEDDSHRFLLLYFSNENVLMTANTRFERSVNPETTFRCEDDRLEITFNLNNSISKVEFDILRLDLNRLELLDIQTNDTLVFRRKLKDKNEKIRSISISNNGLQAIDIQVDNNLQCKAAFNRDTPTEIYESKVPLWKWRALQYLCNSVELKSSTEKIDTLRTVCGGHFAMVIEMENGKVYQYFQPDRRENEIKLINESMWKFVSDGIEKGKKRKGGIKFHEMMRNMDPPLVEMKILQFDPLIK